MKTIPIRPERFKRAFDQRIAAAPPLGRLRVAEEGGIVGKRRGDRFFLYFRRKGLFPLFALTLYGRVKEEALRVSFSRPRSILLPWICWCGLLLYVGLELLFTEPFFALYFLLPGIPLTMPLFLFSRKEKKRLTDALLSLTEKKDPN